MADLLRKTRNVPLLMLLFAATCLAQAPAGDAPGDKPLPDIVAMMHDVENNQRNSETIQKDYIYRSIETQQEVDSHGQTKKTTVNEADHYWLNGVQVRRLVSKNGKPMTQDELAHEDERIDKEVAKAREKREKGDAQGKATTSRGDDEITVSRLIELGSFTNPRREQLNGRDTIAVDYTGDAKAKTRNHAEEVIRDMVGTAWVDEQDHVLTRVEGRFVYAFKVGGGLVVNIRKDTHFTAQWTKINDEVWLPSSAAGEGAMRLLLFFNFSGSANVVYRDYRKFRATTTILPGAAKVETHEEPDGSAKP